METLPTLLDPLKTDLDLLALELPTDAIPATLSLEGASPLSVRLEGDGLGQLQLVKVSVL